MNRSKKYYVSEHRNVLSTSNSKLIEKEFGKMKEISVDEAILLFGIELVEESEEKVFSSRKI